MIYHLKFFCQSQEILYLSIKVNHEKENEMETKKEFFQETHKVSKGVVNKEKGFSWKPN